MQNDNIEISGKKRLIIALIALLSPIILSKLIEYLSI